MAVSSPRVACTHTRALLGCTLCTLTSACTAPRARPPSPSPQAAGNANDAINSVLRLLRKQLVRLPAVSGDSDGEVYLSSDLKKALQAAAKLQKKKGDSFLGECLGRNK